MAKLPFYSRKYGKFFKDYEAYGRFDKFERRKWLIEKHGTYKGKRYSPKR